jgi:hypothetical protein
MPLFKSFHTSSMHPSLSDANNSFHPHTTHALSDPRFDDTKKKIAMRDKQVLLRHVRNVVQCDDYSSICKPPHFKRPLPCSCPPGLVISRSCTTSSSSYAKRYPRKPKKARMHDGGHTHNTQCIVDIRVVQCNQACAREKIENCKTQKTPPCWIYVDKWPNN